MARSRANALAWLLLVAAALRMAAVVGPAPVAGYANQYDMLRTSACIGLWPDLPPPQRVVAHTAAPIPDYVRGERRPDNCYWSTDVALAAAGAWIGETLAVARDGRTIDLRAIGALKLLVLLVALAGVQLRLRAWPSVAVVHAALAFLVLADPFDTLYLNALYTESGALIGLWLAIWGLVLLALEPWSRTAAALLAVGALALGASRLQHLALPVVLLGAAALVCRACRAARPGLLAALVGTIALGAWVAADNAGRFASIAAANRHNMLFGAWLPAHDAPERALPALGLPKGCERLAHSTWYLLRGFDPRRACPEAFAMPLYRVAWSALVAPKATAVFASRGLLLGGAWRMPYVGEVAGGDFARLPSGPLTWSLADAVPSLDWIGLWVLWLTPVTLGGAAFVRLLRAGAAGARSPPAFAVDVALAALAAMVALTWASALFGDGYAEIARHTHLAQNAVLLAWGLLVVRLALSSGSAPVSSGPQLHAPRELEPEAPRTRRLAGFAVAVAISVTTGLASRELPLAYAVLQVPEHLPPHGGAVHVRGVAVAVTPIASAKAVYPDGRKLPLALSEAPGMRRWYPLAGGGAATWSGTIDLPSDADRAVRIEVTDARGVATIVDRLRRSRSP